jgi:hypothetical protein
MDNVIGFKTRWRIDGCDLCKNVFFDKNCLGAGGTRSERKFESYARIAVAADVQKVV